MRHLLPLLVFSIAAAAGCGTGVYNHRIEVTLNDPSNRLGPAPVEVSVFNKTQGSSEDWARRTMGTTAPGAPYVGEVGATDTKMVYDRTPPTDVAAGLALPSLETGGYFVFNVRPAEGIEQTTMLTYASYGVPTREEDQIRPLPRASVAKVRARAGPST